MLEIKASDSPVLTPQVPSSWDELNPNDWETVSEKHENEQINWLKGVWDLTIKKSNHIGPRGSVYSSAQSDFLRYDTKKITFTLENWREDSNAKDKHEIFYISREVGGEIEVFIIGEEIDSFVKNWLENRNPKVKLQIFYILGEVGGEIEVSIIGEEIDSLVKNRQQYNYKEWEKLLDAAIEALMNIGGMTAVDKLTSLAANADLPMDTRISALVSLEELGAGGWVDITDKPPAPRRKYKDSTEISDPQMQKVWSTLDKLIKENSDENDRTIRTLKWKAEAAIAYLERAKPPEKIKFVNFAYSREVGNGTVNATVILGIKDDMQDQDMPYREVTAEADGNGPIEAVCKAIDKILTDHLGMDLTNFHVHFQNVDAISAGPNALAQVTIRVKKKNDNDVEPKPNYQEITREDTDIIKAAALAYIAAANQLFTRN